MLLLPDRANAEASCVDADHLQNKINPAPSSPRLADSADHVINAHNVVRCSRLLHTLS
jgi:hypothetical protein